MRINGITISEDKLAALTTVLSEEVLRVEYELNGKSDVEIATEYGISVNWVNKLRRVYNIKTDEHYQLRRNELRIVPLSDRQKEFLFGSLFGDSCIAVQSSGTGYWICRHGIRQEGYLLKKAEIMKPFTAKVFYGERAFAKGQELFPYVDARSFALPQFTTYRNMFYPNGVKQLSADLLSKLTPAGFAFWFMDDGSTNGYGFNITTYDSFFKTTQAVEIFRDVLNLQVSITWENDGEGNIHVLKNSHDTAWEYIRSEMVDALAHKIPFRYQDNQQPSLDGNVKEGSTTGESLNSKEYGDNARLGEVIHQGTPKTCDEQVMIQSELMGNHERQAERLVRR